MALSEFFTGASDAIREALLEQEVKRRQALLDQLKQQEADRQYELQLKQEQRMRDALQQNRELTEAAKRQTRAQNLAQTILPGESNDDTAKLLDEFGYAGIIKKNPAVRLPVIAARKAPAAAEGELQLLDAPAVDTDVLPERFESQGGFGYQQARLAAQERAAQAAGAQEAAAARAEADRQSREDMNRRDNDMKAMVAGIAASGRNANADLQRELLQSRVDAEREKKDASATQKSQAEQTTRTALGLIDRLLDPNDVGQHIGRATGAYELRGYSQGAQDFNAVRDQVVAMATLPNLGALKGPMSDKDVVFVKQLATRLANTRMSEAETKTALRQLQGFLQDKLSAGSQAAPGKVTITSIQEIK